MSLGQSVRRSVLCGSCRSQVLQSFISVAGLSLPAVRESAPWQRNTRLAQASTFSTQSRRLNQHATSATNDPLTNQESQQLEQSSEPLEQYSPSANNAATSQPPSVPDASQPPANEDAVPWYLQVNPPIAPQAHILSERQRLPDLPPHSPDLLQPILEHVSVDLGIDDLSLLDLRALDPPPALGANLIMVIGTARSEKHLHVSADRLCRWLRSNYAMSPFADGLLGRNELKLKMRRKAKRSRLLSAVGAKETGSGEVDDGIRTGWVCVNVGKVEGGLLPEQQEMESQEVDGFVGFGSQSSGCRIVVQMMTDEKRGDIDLETLWNGILRRSKQKLGDQRDSPQTTDGSTHGRLIEANSSSSPVEETATYRPSAFQRPSDSRNFARAFHTSSIKWSTTQQDKVDDKGAHSPGQLSANRNISDSFSSNRSQQATVILRNLLAQLKHMDSNLAIEALGKGRGDNATTPFLRAFYQAMPSFPDPAHWQIHIELRCYAVCLGHPHYNTKCLLGELDAMRVACVLPTQDTYMAVFETLLKPLLGSNSAIQEPKLYKKAVSSALHVLDMMHEDGYNPVSDPILRLVYQTTALPPLPSYSAFQDEKLASEPQVQQALQGAPLTLVDLLPSLSAYSLATAIASSSWNTARSIWQSYPQQFRSRSSQLYIAYFKSAAKTNNQRIAMDALRSCVPEMPREGPKVKLEGEVAQALKECLDVAEPRAQEMGEKGGRGEWAILWRRLTRALGSK